jgi:hypothetical protein
MRTFNPWRGRGFNHANGANVRPAKTTRAAKSLRNAE